MLDLELMYSIIGCAGFGWAGGMPDCQRVDRRASGRKGYFDAQIPICTTAQMTKVCKKHKFIIEFFTFQITRMCKCWFSVQILLYDFGAWPQVLWIACISMILQKWSMKCNLQLTNNAQGGRMTRVSSNSFKIMHWSCVAMAAILQGDAVNTCNNAEDPVGILAKKNNARILTA